VADRSHGHVVRIIDERPHRSVVGERHEHHPMRDPVTLECLAGATAGEVLAAVTSDQRWYQAPVLLIGVGVVNVEIDDEVGGHVASSAIEGERRAP
jgi:hypothetical protein